MEVCIGLVKKQKHGLTLLELTVRRIETLNGEKFIGSIVDYMVSSEAVAFYTVSDIYGFRVKGWFDPSDDDHLMMRVQPEFEDHYTRCWIQAWCKAHDSVFGLVK